ncbi:putative uncharacterized protein DDB_G0271982 [Teleopsis dalmanni]|uniref:putative uncharacterized protein DDB_G0271982 n=1 Tax=Teleopsis dalmanni TaxID=139649 RepID=UPI0018CED270|nr:putative uncharacterized protein DDB_G0271982 [Teleopsis dalmanni]
MAKKKIQTEKKSVVVTNKTKTQGNEKNAVSKKIKKNNDEEQEVLVKYNISNYGEQKLVNAKEENFLEHEKVVPEPEVVIKEEKVGSNDKWEGIVKEEKIGSDEEPVTLTKGKQNKRIKKQNVSVSSRRAKDALYKRMRRMNPEYREKERIRSRERKKIYAERIRSDPVLLATFREKDRRRKSSARQNDTSQDSENKLNYLNHLIERKDLSRMEIERERNRLRKAARRMDPNYRIQERERDRLRRSTKRQDLQYRAQEQQINTIQRKQRRHMQMKKANPDIKQENKNGENDDRFEKNLLANVDTALNISVQNEKSIKSYIKGSDKSTTRIERIETTGKRSTRQSKKR